MSRLLLRAPRLEYSGSIRRRSHVAASGRRASIDAAAPEPEDWVGLGWVEDEAKGEEQITKVNVANKREKSSLQLVLS